MELGHEGQYWNLSCQQAENQQESAACLRLEAQSGWRMVGCYSTVTPRQHSNVAGCIYCLFTQSYIKILMEEYCLKVGPQAPGNCQLIAVLDSVLDGGTPGCFPLQGVETGSTSEVHL